ncbi:MAG: hypothetical protein DDT42_01011 [candidate division WS2 bacterium]|uniref:Uncharacterized protein n=1 Tax=Psychracetigena formicireducens TaxID=2986056 RepID=A0A9E2BGG2_PSYF1|nr:hypothetical protein [Candidatus Psychracetigena formicireducens]MBT9145141.1 hypothetical protein [Candidatus Psychracetigena formicireducens]
MMTWGLSGIGPLMALGMVLFWIIGITFFVSLTLALYYYIAGKNDEFERAKKILIISLIGIAAMSIVTGLILFAFRYLYW